MNITEGLISDEIPFSCYGMEVKDNEEAITLEPSKADSGVFLVRKEGPLGIAATNDQLTINYGGEYLLQIESSEEKGHILSIIDRQGEKKYVLKANEAAYGLEQDFTDGKIIFDEEGRRMSLYVKDKVIEIEIILQVDGFDDKRKLNYSEVDMKRTFHLEMRSRSEMNLLEINKVEQAFLEENRAGARSASMGVGQSAVAGAIKRSFDVFREQNLQVLRNNVPVIELKVR